MCHDVGFLTLGPKLDPRLAPPFFAGTPNLDPPPFQKSWICPWVWVQGGFLSSWNKDGLFEILGNYLFCVCVTEAIVSGIKERTFKAGFPYVRYPLSDTRQLTHVKSLSIYTISQADGSFLTCRMWRGQRLEALYCTIFIAVVCPGEMSIVTKLVETNT